MTGMVCGALRVERLALRGAAPRRAVGRIGLGPRGVGRFLSRLQRGQAGLPAGIAFAGVGGALAAQVRPGDLVVADEIHCGNGRFELRSAPLLAGALRARGFTVHVGAIRSDGRLVTGSARRHWAEGGELAVDMESGALARGLADLAPGLPLAVVRAIVDTPRHPLVRGGTVVRGITALRALHRAAPVLQQWADSVGEREVLLAGPRSFCAGVTRAIDIVERALARYGGPVYVRRQIVHNSHVVHDLQSRGAVFVEELAQVPPGSVAVLAAHGVSPAVRRQAEERELTVIDATCPLVTKVHAEVRRYAARGDSVLLIGHGDHEEVEGTLGEAPDRVIVIEDAESAARVEVEDGTRVAYAMQTTLAADEAEEIASVLRGRFPGIGAPRTDDICYATTNRQEAVKAVAAEADVVLVVGSANSSNSRRLVEVAQRCGVPAHLVDDAENVDLAWLAGARAVAITAGASAPPDLVEQLVVCLSGLGPIRRREVVVADEAISFALPSNVV